MCQGASQAELQRPRSVWRVQASPLPQPAYWSMVGKKEEMEEGEMGGGGQYREQGDRDGWPPARGGGGDVDAEGEVEKVNPELECERNAGNGDKRLGREGGSIPKAPQNTHLFLPSVLPSLSLLCKNSCFNF